MKAKLIAFAVCGALIASTGAAFARPPHHDNRKPAAHHYRGMYQQGRAQGWYKKGGRLPPAYRGRSYAVTNWHSHRRLYAPPRGYHWVRSNNGDYLLVAVTTGVIAGIVAAAVAGR